MVDAGALIWISARPLLRMFLCSTSGFILARYDLFNAMAARGASQVMLNITLPSLLFSKMVPAFTAKNIAAIGPLLTIACIYQALGLLIALITREVFWVPHRFRSGLLVAGTWANYGDVPIAVVTSITSVVPFQPDDANLSVAYIAAFTLIFFVTLFPLGGHQLVAKDFEGPNMEDEEVKEMLRARQKRWITSITGVLRLCKLSSSKANSDIEQSNHLEAVQPSNFTSQSLQSARPALEPLDTSAEVISGVSVRPRRQSKQVNFEEGQHRHTKSNSFDQANTSPTVISPTASTYGGADLMSPTTTVIAPTENDFEKEKNSSPRESPEKVEEVKGPSSSSVQTSKSLFQKMLGFLRSLLTPATISMFLAFPCALIKPLKGLFVNFEGSPIPNAPDGRPPLYFILDATTFLGAASVPLGLVCLGAALAKLKMPRTVESLPVGAIASLALGKLVISPIIGVLIVNAFVKIGFIDENDKVLRFVTMFFSCMPTATTQVFLTQVYSGTGEAEYLSPFLIPQYALMFISTTALTAYSLHLLF